MMTSSQRRDPNALNWQIVIRSGLISGVILLYIGVIGMIAAFNEREVVRDLVTMGQLMVFLPPLFSGYLTARRLRTDNANQDTMMILLSGLVIGLLTAIPTILLVLVAEPWDVRSVLVNVSRDWLEIITFDNRDNLILGSGMILGALGLTGFIGSLLYLIPEKPRQALLFGFSLTLILGTFGETLRLILQEILPRDALDVVLRRDTLKQGPALVIFLVATAASFAWAYMGSNVTSRYQGLPAPQKTTSQRVGYVVFIAVLLALPWIVGRSLSDVMVTVGLFVLMGLGLNIAIGLAGLLDLGYVTNYAVGAYVMAVLTSTGPLGLGGGIMNFWLVLPIAILCAMFAGFVFAVPVLKMRGDYLAIATLGFGEIIGKLAISDALRPIIGGAQGVLFIPKPIFFGMELKNPEQLYYVVLAACILTLVVSIRINNSRTGRQWMAIREDEDVAAAMGIDVARAKLLAFTLSAATGGLAGAIFAAKVGTVFPNSFIVLVSINVLSLIIVGGMGSNPGIIVGAIVLLGMPELLREFSEYRWLLYGVLLIFMMINRPEGFIPSKVRQREMQDAIESSAAGVGD